MRCFLSSTFIFSLSLFHELETFSVSHAQGGFLFLWFSRCLPPKFERSSHLLSSPSPHVHLSLSSWASGLFWTCTNRRKEGTSMPEQPVPADSEREFWCYNKLNTLQLSAESLELCSAAHGSCSSSLQVVLANPKATSKAKHSGPLSSTALLTLIIQFCPSLWCFLSSPKSSNSPALKTWY